MRFFLIFILLFVLRFMFLPMDIDSETFGFTYFTYHILMGVFIGMTAVIVDRQFEKIKQRKKK